MLTSVSKIKELSDLIRDGDILVAQSISPEIISLMNKASGVVTDQGGMLSHAAIVSRELKIPCIVGTKEATLRIKTGDIIEVDAFKAVVKIL